MAARYPARLALFPAVGNLAFILPGAVAGASCGTRSGHKAQILVKPRTGAGAAVDEAIAAASGRRVRTTRGLGVRVVRVPRSRVRETLAQLQRLFRPEPDDRRCRALAQARGAIVVAGAGNHGSGKPFYPAAYPGALGVAATDRDDRRYASSAFGSWVSVAAPACNETTTLGGSFAAFRGTSAAAPW